MEEKLRLELLAMQREDLEMREELLRAGELEKGYHPRMESVHRKNAARLREMLEELGGWPTQELVGPDGAEAAWLVLQHAIGEPELQRSCLPLLEAKADAGEIPKWQAAYLEDRIAFFEGRPQRFGTQLFHDADGYETVYMLAEPERVGALRASVGLPPLRDVMERRAEQVPMPLEDLHRKQHEGEVWARRVGWRK